ncbi:MAG: hypothetical protein M1817_004457 [Caeruleum heppii]|nr:MAG: hypothetical protein M1817_004457 [Caeruleum heppii]
MAMPALYILLSCFLIPFIDALPSSQTPLLYDHVINRNITVELFAELEELSRIVDISYCVGTTGIQKPFLCASRCQDFAGFELVTTWHTGPLLSDSCGYIALSHPPSSPRIIVAFRGTYSVANTVADLSTIPQEYVPYPPDDGEEVDASDHDKRSATYQDDSKCANCTVHYGFLRSWKHTRPHVLPHIERLTQEYPDYRLTLVGHSLGGAVAALASLDFSRRAWNPQVTTFGEPRIGNMALMKYIDARFNTSNNGHGVSEFHSYRRVTHVNDPVPLLPLEEWGYHMHSGEIYISKPELSPAVTDLERCQGDEDPRCIAGAGNAGGGSWVTVPPRFRIWQLFFAHRDYFWRLGLCVPGGDPHDWYH